MLKRKLKIGFLRPKINGAHLCKKILLCVIYQHPSLKRLKGWASLKIKSWLSFCRLQNLLIWSGLRSISVWKRLSAIRLQRKFFIFDLGKRRNIKIHSPSMISPWRMSTFGFLKIELAQVSTSYFVLETGIKPVRSQLLLKMVYFHICRWIQIKSHSFSFFFLTWQTRNMITFQGHSWRQGRLVCSLWLSSAWHYYHHQQNHYYIKTRNFFYTQS